MGLASVLGKGNDAVPVAHLYAVGEMLLALEVIPQPPRPTVLVAKRGNIDGGGVCERKTAARRTRAARERWDRRRRLSGACRASSASRTSRASSS